MKNRINTKVHRHSKSSDRERRSQSIERGYSEKEVLSSMKREFTLSNASPRKRKVRVRTQSQTPTTVIPRLNVSKNLFEEKAFDGLTKEIPPSIKREPSFEDYNVEIKMPSVQTGRETLSNEISSKFKRTSQNKENKVFPCIKREPSFEDSTETKMPNIKTERKSSFEEISNFTTPLRNKEKEVFSSNNKNSSATKSSAKAGSESKRRSLFSSKTHPEERRSPRNTPPTTPYALNRPQRNRIPPLAYWRGEYRTFRTLINGDIILIDFHIPEYTEEPRRKRRKLS